LYLLRCPRPFLREVKRHLPPAGPQARSSTQLGDWFARRLNVGPRRYVMATSRLSLLSVVVPARDLPLLPARIAGAVEALLLGLGVPMRNVAREVGEMGDAVPAPADSPAVLATMRYLAETAAWDLRDLEFRPGRTLHHVNVWLSETPCGLLGGGSPASATLDLMR
jgi:hypothetical protein